MTPALEGWFAPHKRRIQGMIARAVVRVVNDAVQAQELQIDILADETHDGVERFQNYGFTSTPHAGAEAAVIFVGGLRSHGIAIAVEDRRYRLKGLADGEVAIYDDLGQVVQLQRTGVLISSPMRVDVKAPIAAVTADQVMLGGEGGEPVARVGDPVVDNKIAAGSTKVTAA